MGTHWAAARLAAWLRSDVSFQQDFANNAARVAELNARTLPATHDTVLQTS